MARVLASLNSSYDRKGKVLPSLTAAADILGVRLSDERLMKLVADMLHPQSLPKGWSSEFNTHTSKWSFKDKHGQQHSQHPLHGYYLGAIFMDQGGWAALKRTAVDQPPTIQQVRQMGSYLHIKESEGDYMWAVAEMALCAPLPPDWQEEVGAGAHVIYRNLQTNTVHLEHPLDGYFRELLRRRRRELKRRHALDLETVQHHEEAKAVVTLLSEVDEVLEQEPSLPGSCDGYDTEAGSVTPASITQAQSRATSGGSRRGAASSPGMSTHGISPLSRAGSGAFEASRSWNGSTTRQLSGRSSPGSTNRLLVRTIASLRPETSDL